MGTRSTTHFVLKSGADEAIVYRHWDGYPSGAGQDLLDFIEECRALKDSRLNDPSYLAARYVVFLSELFRREDAPRLDFLSVGIVTADPLDIEYRYIVEPGGHVRCFQAYCTDWHNPDSPNAWSAVELDLAASIAAEANIPLTAPVPVAAE